MHRVQVDRVAQPVLLRVEIRSDATAFRGGDGVVHAGSEGEPLFGAHLRELLLDQTSDESALAGAMWSDHRHRERSSAGRRPVCITHSGQRRGTSPSKSLV